MELEGTEPYFISKVKLKKKCKVSKDQRETLERVQV